MCFPRIPLPLTDGSFGPSQVLGGNFVFSVFDRFLFPYFHKPLFQVVYIFFFFTLHKSSHFNACVVKHSLLLFPANFSWYSQCLCRQTQGAVLPCLFWFSRLVLSAQLVFLCYTGKSVDQITSHNRSTRRNRILGVTNMIIFTPYNNFILEKCHYCKQCYREILCLEDVRSFIYFLCCLLYSWLLLHISGENRSKTFRKERLV